MPLSIFNTLTGRKDPFEPREPGRIGLYVCGPTVYDSPHLGHARSAVVFDVIARYLAYRFPDHALTYVRNYTDIEDKIIRRAAEEGRSWEEVASQFATEYDRDMEVLGCRRPDVAPRATEHVPAMIALIERLLAGGFAYRVDGDVYFRVARFPAYGRLSHRNLEELKAGARVEVDERKADPLDFALWKAAKPGEPAWPSPWGPGRPGWHIECSAMSMQYLGEQFDLHGGGQDLIFPHHENEIAQSEAATGKSPFARYWVHHGFVRLNAEKMSKSLGNVVRVRDLLGSVRPEVLRLFLLSVHYRSPIEFAPALLEEAKKTLDYFYTFLARVADVAAETRRSALAGAGALEAAAFDVPEGLRADFEAVGALERRFQEAMDDDFNTPVAFAAMHEATRAANRIADGMPAGPGRAIALQAARQRLTRVGAVLGLLQQPAGAWLKGTAGWAPGAG
ncbi:MAG TPA: cysteine--tRNA ligase, partial [Thermodesulfobacteriota bacterium]|nr:cysteine--tRNA ligase [Thermodesulfobacteriota bacterium]